MYDKFKNKVIKKMKVKNFILRHIVLFITLFIILLGSIGAVVFNIGNLISFNTEDITVQYGDDNLLNGKVFLSKPYYEYKQIDDDEWFEGIPNDIGEYHIKAYGKDIFGNKEYSNPIKYKVVPRVSDVFVTDKDIIYGEKIDVNFNLAYHDYVSNINFDYKLAEDVVYLNPIQDTIVIKNRDTNEDVTHKYDLSVGDTTIKFTKADITVSTSDVKLAYTGKEIENRQYFITSGSLGYRDKIEVNFKYNKVTDVVKDKNYFDSFKIINRYGKDVTHFYNVKFDYGDLEVFHRHLFMYTESRIKKDDGSPLSHEKYSYKGLIDGHKLKVNSTSTLNESGTIKNDIDFNIFNEDDEDVTSNYRIYKYLGNLTICPSLTITSNSKSKEYDGTSLIDETFEVSEEIPSNHKIKVTDHSEITDYGKVENKLEYRIYNDLNEDVTEYYTINYEYGTLSIEKRKIDLTSNEDRKMYDGDSLHEVTFKTDRLLNNHKININEVYNLGVDVGFYENSFDFNILDENNNDVSKNYEVNTIWNDKEIYKREIKVLSEDSDTTYNNQETSKKEYDIKEYGLVLDHKINITKDFPSFINAGNYENNFECNILDGNDNDVTSNYDIKYYYGRINIRKRPIGILTKSKSVQYNKESIKLEGYELRAPTLNDGLLENHVFTMIGDYKTFIEPGYHTNSIDFKITDENGLDITENYVGVDFGHISINQPTITITTDSAKKEYDGLPLTNPNYTIENEYDYLNFDINVIGSITHVGKVDNDAIIKITDKDGKEIDDLYKIDVNYGKLEIVPPKNGQLNNGTGNIVNSGEIATKPQNSSAANEEEAFEYSTNCVDKIYFRAYSFGDYAYNKWEKATPYKYDNSNISPMYYSSESLNGYYQTREIRINLTDNLDYLLPYYTINGPTYENDFDNKVVNRDNEYDLTFIPYVYDYRDNMRVNNTLKEQEHAYYEFVKQNYLSIPETTKIEMLKFASANQLNPNSENIVLEVQNVMRKTATYNEKFKEYPKDVDMAVHFLSKTREGNSQHFATSATCLYRALGIPARYTIGFISSPSSNYNNIVSWGDARAWVEVYVEGMGWISTDVCARVVDTDEENKAPDIQEKNDIYIKPMDVCKGIDDSPVTPYNEIDLNYSANLTNLVDKGYTYKVKVGGIQSEIGVSDSYIEDFKLFDPNGFDVTSEYDIYYMTGKIEVTKTQAIFRIPSKTIYYDGKGITLHHDEVKTILPNGYRAEYDFNVNYNQIGDIDVKPTNIKIYNGNIDVTNDLYIKIEGGHLSIKKIPIEITIASDEKFYDGKPLTNPNYRFSKGKLLPNHKENIEINASITDIGTVVNIPNSIQIVDEHGKNVKFCYDIHVKQGILKVI